MSIRVRYLVAGLATVAVGVVLVLVLRGGDAEKGETVLGKPARGFPLRGSLAADDEAIAAAVSAWRERAKEDDDEDEADDATDNLRPDEDEDVLVLWAGRVGEQRRRDARGRRGDRRDATRRRPRLVRVG